MEQRDSGLDASGIDLQAVRWVHLALHLHAPQATLTTSDWSAQ